jgi:hypothetical protein
MDSLAYAETYLVLTALFRDFNLELFNTNKRDVDPVVDHFIPFPESERGVRVTVH